MATVKHKILVLSGKGGVGKSTFSAQLAFALAAKVFQVGLSISISVAQASQRCLVWKAKKSTRATSDGLPSMLSPTLVSCQSASCCPTQNDAVIWRGPQKNGIIKQFLKVVYWGQLDFLVVDAPPGTSYEHILIFQYLPETGIDGAITVTSPQQVSLIDVRKEVSFCKKVGLQVLGVVVKMSGLSQLMLDFKFLKVTETGEEKNVTEWAVEYLRERAPELLDLVGFTKVYDSSGGGAAKM